MSQVDLNELFEGYGPSTAVVSGLSFVGSLLPQLTLGSRGFQIKQNREVTPLLDAQKRPVTSVSVVILGISPNISRAYYEAEYNPNAADQMPDCASDDGVAPNEGVPHPQSDLCASCPMNAWGSSRNPGSRAKACREFKRIALASVSDLDCTAAGAPLMFSVPPASHPSLDQLYRALKVLRLPEWAVCVTLEYDFSRTYPAITFAVERQLDLTELAKARRAMRAFHERIARSFGLDTESYALPPCPPMVEQAAAALPPLDAPASSAPKPALAAPTPQPQPQPKPQPKPKAPSMVQPKPQPQPQFKPEPEPERPITPEQPVEPWVDEEEEDDVDQLFNKLRNAR